MSTVTTLPSVGQHVYIESRFREPNASPSDFRVPTFNQTLQNDVSCIVRVRKVIFDNFIPTITAGVNDRVSYIVNGTTYVVILAEGFYDVDRILLAFNTSFTANFGATLIMSYDSTTYKMGIIIPVGCTFTWVRVIDPLRTTQNRWDLQVPQDRLLSMLGFLPQTSVPYVGSASPNPTLIAQFPLNLKPTKYVDMSISTQLSVLHSSPFNPQTMINVPITTNYGETEVYIPGEPPSFLMRSSDLEYLNFRFTDEYGALISLPANTSTLIHMVIFRQNT